MRDALPAALEQDWRAEVPEKLCRQVRRILGDKQSSLFGDQRADRLEALRREIAGFSLGNAFLDYAVQTAAQGRCSEEAIRQAAANAIADRATRGARQVEEHYCRESTQARAGHVRERIESGASRSDIAEIAGRLVGIDKSEEPLAPAKQTGLDDGVQP